MPEHPYDHTIRVLICPQCGAPVDAALSGGQTTCKFCGAQMVVAPRTETPALDVKKEVLSEARRFEVLRSQDGRPLMPPSGLRKYMSGGVAREDRAEQILAEWQKFRKEMETPGAVFQTQERFYFLTELLAQIYSSNKDYLKQRALLETALDFMTEPRFIQSFRSNLSRNAIRMKDLVAAEQWLALCDPKPMDLHMDSEYRVARSAIATLRGDWAEVISNLGETPDDVPIADTLDILSALLRINALEKRGDLENAKAQLYVLSEKVPGGPDTLGMFISANDHLSLCEQSFDTIKAQALAQSKKKSAGCGCFGGLTGLFFLVAGAVLLLIGLKWGTPGFIRKLATPNSDDPFQVVGFILLFWGILSFGIRWFMKRQAKNTQFLLEKGIDGDAEVLSIEKTNTRINDQPLVKLSLMIKIEGKPPYKVTLKKVFSEQDFVYVRPGMTLPIKVHPTDPDKILLGG